MIIVRIVKSSLENNDTLFIDIMDLFPECVVFIKNHTALDTLCCLRPPGFEGKKEIVCTQGNLCMERLHKRICTLFDVFPNISQVFCKFGIEGMTKPDIPGLTERKLQKQRAVLFTPYDAPRYVTFNGYYYDNTVKYHGDLFRIDESRLDWNLDKNGIESHPAVINYEGDIYGPEKGTKKLTDS